MKRKTIFILIPLLAFAGLFLFASQPTKPAVATKTDSKKYIYLTFDDGPLNGSQNIDSVILAEKIKISVFLVGKHVLANRKMDDYFKYYEENPYIDEYNHSFSHAKNHYEQFYSHTDSAVADILHNNALLKFPNKIVRLPGRNMWRINGHKRNVSNGYVAGQFHYLIYLNDF